MDAYVGEKQADGGPWYDEMLHADRSIRPAWTEVAAGLAELGGTGLRRLRQQVNRMLDDDGVTYNPVDDVRAQPAPPAAPAHRGAPGQPVSTSPASGTEPGSRGARCTPP